MATPDDISWWRGRLSNRTPPTATTSVRAPRERAQSSGAGAFLALADDGRQYWVKVPGNEQGNQVLVNEVIVGELGRLLDAPVRERVLVTIPAAITGWAEFPIPSSARPLLAQQYRGDEVIDIGAECGCTQRPCAMNPVCAKLRRSRGFRAHKGVAIKRVRPFCAHIIG